MNAGGDPVELFARDYKDRFAKITHDFLEKAVHDSGIDTEINAQLAKKIDLMVAERQRNSSGKGLWSFLLLLLLAGGCCWFAWLVWQDKNGHRQPAEFWIAACVYAVGALLFIFFVCVPKIRGYEALIQALDKRIAEQTEEAKRMLLPFFRQFGWCTLTDLIEQVMPGLSFDDFLTEGRLRDLAGNFGMSGDELGSRSVLYTHSGSFHGYPFVFLDTKSFTWGTKTYYGSKEIHWTESVTGPDGKKMRVHRSQTLTASVTKPIPCFKEEKFFFFGHDAAPHLSFSREPSSLSGAEDSLFTSIGKSFKMRKLRKFEQNLTDESNYTMVSNHDFELLFSAVNRDHEVEFRLLFTPLAQRQMVNLLNDKKVGFGDDFYYQKTEQLTCMVSRHLLDLDFSTEPTVLPDYHFEAIRQTIQKRYEDFFRRIYFTFAPLMTIPLYNEPRVKVPSDCLEPRLSAWELESIANYQGQRYYQHPKSITDNLLMVEDIEVEDGMTVATVTSHGFRGIKRVDYVTEFGGDGRLHDVPVHWVEYEEVQRTSRLRARPIRNNQDWEQNGIFRRSVWSWLPN